jgi:hypothetical protein
MGEAKFNFYMISGIEKKLILVCKSSDLGVKDKRKRQTVGRAG